ncbi:hypothetical protein CG394_05155 [Gardnerella vaginalis]|uniref:Bro-N domain-containing protein n=1 Tax=Gardnerella vaginalis (strain ATCC 14019 / 317) TaxID=525284 RepID=E3D820_GARV3|nr:hypothetical protein HMPREF0421_21315 [Gardnerella vaginalis ATCC 14019]KOS09435.1 antirepressor [Gardnerella vaginalis]TCH82060.1 hypothetical protein E0E46_04460 [Gardnerella vaginalis ATCC 14018 = JCM 11026]PMC50092.1 hypothetical protein CJ212_04985 [Gardnerella vaginalis]RFT24066.1 hypothetical protein CG394_05155 [Gardnerella vaginalis]
MSTFCRQLKLASSDGKKYETDSADMQGILLIVQSIPSPKSEPFKMWLSTVGKERIDEVIYGSKFKGHIAGTWKTLS